MITAFFAAARSLPAAGLVLLLIACAAGEAPSPAAVPESAGSPEAQAGPIFEEVAAASGLDFRHLNGMDGNRYFVEMMGAGGGMLDYDGDGDMDLFMVQGHPLGAEAGAPGAEHRHRLFRNDTTAAAEGAQAGLRFTEATEDSGIDARGYGMGLATGDYDNDGHVDLYLANWGPNQLWRNNGDGTFSDVTEATGTDDPRWSSGASFVDFDRDGWLDLYVANYDRYSIETDHPCFSAVSGRRDYCGPQAYPYEPDRLLRNRGDGTFEDVTIATGVAAAVEPALGATAGDFDADGWPDLYVTNDGENNIQWMNRAAVETGRRRFEDTALLSGTAVNRAGAAEASMGVVAADADGDCDEDLFMTHLKDETNTLYINDGTGLFEDRSQASGLGPPSGPMTAFGVADLDFDNDGRLDFFVANGEVRIIEAQAAAGDPLPLRQRNQLFRGLGEGRFEELPAASAGPSFAVEEVGRGAAMGDLDDDGDTDLLVTANDGPARLLVNRRGQERSWIGLRLLGGEGGRDMLGAQVRLELGAGKQACRRVRTDGSYQSAHDPRVLFGLGDRLDPVDVTVTWPDGAVEAWEALTPQSYHRLIQGQGKPAGEPAEAP